MRQNVVMEWFGQVDAKSDSDQCYILGEKARTNKFMTLDMKSLVDDILASREGRAKALEDIKKDTHHILGDAKKILSDAWSLMKEFAKEGEERVQEVKKMGQEVKSFLKSTSAGRKQDFEATMKNIRESLKDISHNVSKVREDARGMVSRYHHSRMNAKTQWASLQGQKKAKKQTPKEKSGE